MRSELGRRSRRLGGVFRHAPRRIGLECDRHGRVDARAPPPRRQARGGAIHPSTPDEILAADARQRPAFDDDHPRTRANEAYSIDVARGLRPAEPPRSLGRGTATRLLKSMDREGLWPGRRFVHPSFDIATAREVGPRRGMPAVWSVQARAVHAAENVFHRAANDVWRAGGVPARCITACTPSRSRRRAAKA